MSNRFPKIVDLQGHSRRRSGFPWAMCAKKPEFSGASPLSLWRFFPISVFFPELRQKNSPEGVDMSKKLLIIGASMIEARMSRVRPPKVQDREDGKGLPPRFRAVRLKTPEPGRGRRSHGLSPHPGWSAVVDSSVSCVRCEVMTTCHDFLF